MSDRAAELARIEWKPGVHAVSQMADKIVELSELLAKTEAAVHWWAHHPSFGIYMESKYILVRGPRDHIEQVPHDGTGAGIVSELIALHERAGK